MARKRTDAEPADETDSATATKVSKADAVRAALADGVDTPDEGVAYILKKFGIEMGKPMWSSYRSQEKARLAKKAAGGAPGRRGRTPRVDSAPVGAPFPVPALNGSIGLAGSVGAIKELVDHLGVDQVVSIAKLFGK
ncbi:MAG TPA: hypothetical protein VH092_22875 [Urbifossiella sp.]|jgi:hypothetical protein|nr:hypothetical protein [Urbifossiella sp.]